MKRLIVLKILLASTFFIFGCLPEQKNDPPLWEKIKITDLAPISKKNASASVIHAAYFDVYTVQIPAQNAQMIIEIWKMFNTRQLHFHNLRAFKANGFLARFADVEKWDHISDILAQAGAHKINTTSILIPKDTENYFEVKKLDEDKEITYTQEPGLNQNISIGPGELVFKIQARDVPVSRGTSKVTLTPCFNPPLLSTIPELAQRELTEQICFDQTALTFDMSPSQMLIIGPERYDSDPASLANNFFCVETPKQAIRIHLIVCTGVNY